MGGQSKEPAVSKKEAVRKSKGHWQRILYWVFTGVVIVVGAGILFYPVFSNSWNAWRNKGLESNYQEKVLEDPHQYDKIWSEAEAYNAQHTFNAITDVFDKEGEYILTHPYDSLLDPSGKGIMGFLKIPRIRLDVAVYHGTGQEALEKGVGHVEGTSLPIGGENSHSVLAAHRGLPSAKLFTDLDQIKKGDKFFIIVMDKKLAYEVDKIKVVFPYQTEDLAIAQGKDYVTLLTCTPYGVNTQRLLVRGSRIPYLEKDVAAEKEKSSIVDHHSLPTRALLIGLGVLFLLILIFLLIRRLRDRGGKDKEREEK